MLAAGLSLIVLDGTIVGVALPQIIAALDLHLTDAQWINSLYAMIFAALLLWFGRLADRFGRRRIFLAGIVVFVVGSLTAAQADSGSALIASRALQGFGGAMILPTTLSTVNATFRGKDRAVAFGIWGAVMAGMAAIGPLLGGWLTTTFDWRWIFWVNLPLGILIVIGALLVVPETRGEHGRPGLDVDGLLTSAIGLGLVVFALIEGTSLGWWRPVADFSVLGLTWSTSMPISIVPVAFVVGLVFLALFLLWERHRAGNGRDALLDLRLFSIPTFTWGNATALSVAAGEFVIVFVLPLYLVNVLGLTILQAGFVLAAMALGAFLSGASARHVAARFSPTTVVVAGLSLELVGIAVTVLAVSATTSPWLIAATMAVYGVGLGLASAQLTSTVLRDVPPAQSGSASATQSTTRQVGSALGTALAGTALAASLSHTVPAALAALGLPATQVDQAVAATTRSAGGIIAALREGGAGAAGGQFGPLGPQLADALAQAFASSTRISLLVAVGFLVLGLVGSLRVASVARHAPSVAESHAG